MKPAAIVVADEMFPEGVGPYMEIEEVTDLVIHFFSSELFFCSSCLQLEVGAVAIVFVILCDIWVFLYHQPFDVCIYICIERWIGVLLRAQRVIQCSRRGS